jgi:MoaA/NifB/PqqE/SkfB family radical SAM enzyme
MAVRALLKIGHACNNDCVFCHAADRSGNGSLEWIVARAVRARELGARTLVVSGGEPTLRADLVAIADRVSELGLELGLVTNGRLLAGKELREALIDRGLRYVYVSLHAADPVLHDSLVGASGAFVQTMTALRAMHGRVRDLHVNTVVTRDNLGSLRDMADLASTLPQLSLKFTMPQPKGAALRSFDRVVPNVSDAAMAVQDAIRHGGTRRPAARLGHEGFPLCLLPGLEDLQDNLRTHGFLGMCEVGESDFAPIDDLLLMHPGCCESCHLRPRCPGIYKEYAARRGVGELRPRAAAQRFSQPTTAAPPAQSSSPPGSRPSSAVPAPLDDLATREAASQEQRCWVRLTYACNNRCLFCLDKETGRSDARDHTEIRREIVEGRRRGAERLILSGGEATTHPQFLEFVRVGKLAGYRWVQCVSNGRMFSYPQFLGGAIKAGLDELTVSMHGHTAELHDALVGVSGAFEQASKAVRDALADGRIVVNIDIVINARNVVQLPSMIETFTGWGVREFDLLHIIPFGNAWKLRKEALFYDVDAQAEGIRKALEIAHGCGARVWLNRFPPEHAEGFESLIQDPYKLYDEVRGRASEFEAWRDGGPPLPCREPGRCERCYLRKLCDAFEAAIRAIASGELSCAHITLPAPGVVPSAHAQQLEITALKQKACESALQVLRADALLVRVDAPSKLAPLLQADGTLWGTSLGGIVVSSPQALQEALAIPGSFDVIVELDRPLAALLPQLSAFAHRLVLRQPTYEKLTTQHERDVDPSLWATLPFPVRVQGVAPCMTTQPTRPLDDRLDLDMLDASGRLETRRFTSSFVREKYFVKSLRCRRCGRAGECAGMHVNWVRSHGFATMRPF